MRRGWSLAIAALTGVGVFGLVFLEDTAFDEVLPNLNPDVYLWTGGLLAALVGAGVLAYLADSGLRRLASGAAAGAGGYLVAMSLPMLALGLFGGFGCAYPQATWEQPGLYDTATSTQAPEGWTIEASQPDGLAFANATLDEAWGSDRYNLTQVTWEGPTVAHGRGNQLVIQLTSPMQVTTRVRGEANETTIAAAFGTLASNVTPASRETIDDWTQQFLDSRHPAGGATRIDPVSGNRTSIRFYEYSLNLTGPLTITEHYAELAPPVPAANLSSPYGGPAGLDAIGRASTSTGNWTFDFAFPSLHAENQDVDGGELTDVRVDVLDRVGAEASLGDSNDYHNRTVALVHAAFDELGWPEPTVTSKRVQMGAIC